MLVLGDVMLDRYVWGDVDRISPEAPIPVVRVNSQSTMPGGAGNVARNLASLGARVHMVSVVGDDAPASHLAQSIESWKISAAGLIRDGGRATTEKTRVIARGQQVVRYDREDDHPLSTEIEDRVIDAVRAQAADVRGAILEDYGKGVLSRRVIAESLAIFAERGVRVFVDPKEPPWDVFAGVELIKPNGREAEQVTGELARSDEEVARAAARVLEISGARTVAITRSEHGLTLLERGGDVVHVPATPRAVHDAAGAGDTAIAALSLARVADASWVEAATVANAAAGHVVSVRGTATVSPAELLAALEHAP